jgi:hypothetical protein
VVVAITILLVLAGRMLIEGRAAMRRATELDRQGEVEAAIGAAMRAAKSAVPLSPHPRRAYDLLRTIAHRAEASGDVETALVAWQAIRGAAIATRGIGSPAEERRVEADREIAAILATRPAPGVDRDKTAAVRAAEHRAELAVDVGPAPWVVVALYLSLGVWLAGALRLARAIDQGRDPAATALARRRAVAAAALALIGLGAFALIAWRA